MIDSDEEHFEEKAKLATPSNERKLVANQEYWTTLDWAVYDGDLPTVQKLLAKRTSEDAKRRAIMGLGEKKVNLIMVAASQGHIGVLRYLLSCCQLKLNLNARSKTPDRCTAMHFAASSGYKKVVRLLAEHGADVDILDLDELDPDGKDGGLSPLAYACQYGNLITIKTLLELGAGSKDKSILTDALSNVCVANGARGEHRQDIVDLLKVEIETKYPRGYRGAKRPGEELIGSRYPRRSTEGDLTLKQDTPKASATKAGQPSSCMHKAAAPSSSNAPVKTPHASSKASAGPTSKPLAASAAPSATRQPNTSTHRPASSDGGRVSDGASSDLRKQLFEGLLLHHASHERGLLMKAIAKNHPDLRAVYECVVLGQQKQQPGHVTALATTITLLLGLVKHGYLEVPEEGSSGAGGVVSGLKTHVLSKLVGEGASDAEAAITVLTAMAEGREQVASILEQAYFNATKSGAQCTQQMPPAVRTEATDEAARLLLECADLLK